MNEVVLNAALRFSGMVLRWCCCVYGLPSCSLKCLCVSDEGAMAICAALVHLTQLQTLEYVVCPTVSTGP